jgi:hypothetical protein
MTLASLVAWLILVLTYATIHQPAIGAEPWEQARQPIWGDEPDYRRGYELRSAAQDRDPRYPDAHRAGNRQGSWSGTGYGDYGVAPAQGRGLDGFVDRDGRWMEYAREPTGYDRDGHPIDEAGRYPGSSWRGAPDFRVETDDRDMRGGWRDVTPLPTYRNDVSGSEGRQPEYRFRGDPQPSSGRWGGSDVVQGYRFRPLNDREAEQRVQTPGWRPLEPVRGDRRGRPSAPAGLMDALTPPPRTFGFEPTPGP